MLMLTDADFNRLHAYTKASCSISPSKEKQLIIGRFSSTLTSRGYRNFSEYVGGILTGQDKEMITSMLNRLTTDYTYPLCEEAHFQFLQDAILPDPARECTQDKVLSMWSAGCSSGEEPYATSVYLKEFLGFQANSWDTRILITDISQQILNKARNLVYREESLGRLSSSWKQKYFVRNEDSTYTIVPAIKQNAIFQTFNLMNSIRSHRPFDLIFCRNVMIYFNQVTEDALVQRFYDTTVPGTYLLIGHSEGLNKVACPYEYLIPAIYQKIRR